MGICLGVNKEVNEPNRNKNQVEIREVKEVKDVKDVKDVKK
jgi:hypothetical protein